MVIKCMYPKMYPFTLKTVGRLKSIKATSKGFYFVHGGKRIYLDEIQTLSYPYFYRDPDGWDGFIGGYIPLCNWGGLYVEVMDEIESVRLWDIVPD